MQAQQDRVQAMPISTAPAEKWSDLAALLGDCLVVHAGVKGKRPDLDALFASLSNETLTFVLLVPGCPLRLGTPAFGQRQICLGAIPFPFPM